MRSFAGRSSAGKTKVFLVAALILVGVLVRFAAWGRFPGGVNQDEAYSAYEAYCLLNGGMDSWGYRYPVYLTTWGSGMNALQSYLMMPFIALFGLKTWVLRLPQALIACASLPAMYLLLKRLFDVRTAMTGLAFLAICPWHIGMARWGMESNLAPGMVLLGFMFFVLSLERPVYFLASGLCYGLSLYAYATIWPVLPFMIALQGLYAFYMGRLKWSKWLLCGGALLALLAVPLLLFLVVNWGLIDEIRLPIVSVPKLLRIRSEDISFSHLYENIYRMVKTFLLQRDDMVWNASDEFGLYYHISLPFMLIGGAVCVWKGLRSLWTRRFDSHMLLLVWLVLGAVQGCLINGNVIRMNYLHFPMMICAVLGIRRVCVWVSGRIKWFPHAIVAAYSLCFVLFVGFYFTEYQQMIARHYNVGLEPALAYAREISDGDIRISESISYPKILFYGQIEPEVFRETVVWRGGPSAFMRMESVEGYRFGADEAALHEGVSVLTVDEIGDELPDGLTAMVFDQIAVVYRADPSEN